jgi:hypothetical protein
VRYVEVGEGVLTAKVKAAIHAAVHDGKRFRPRNARSENRFCSGQSSCARGALRTASPYQSVTIAGGVITWTALALKVKAVFRTALQIFVDEIVNNFLKG